MPYCHGGLDRLSRVLVQGDPAIGIEPWQLGWLWVDGSELGALIRQTRSMLERELVTRNAARRRDGVRRINVQLYLGAFDAWCEGSRKAEAGRDQGYSRERVRQVCKELRGFESVKRFIAALQERIALRELSHSYVSRYNGAKKKEEKTEFAGSNGLPG